MARRINNCELSILSIEESRSYLNRDAPFSLLIRLIHNVGKLKAWLGILLTEFLVFADVLLRHRAKFMQQVPCQRRLA
jgi:hypothetical protein